MNEIIIRIVDDGDFQEYKESYGKTIICGQCKIGGFNVGIVANQKCIVKDSHGKIQLVGVVYNDSADKAAIFIEKKGAVWSSILGIVLVAIALILYFIFN